MTLVCIGCGLEVGVDGRLQLSSEPMSARFLSETGIITGPWPLTHNGDTTTTSRLILSVVNDRTCRDMVGNVDITYDLVHLRPDGTEWSFDYYYSIDGAVAVKFTTLSQKGGTHWGNYREVFARQLPFQIAPGEGHVYEFWATITALADGAFAGLETYAISSGAVATVV